jgi:hypothetical protein
MTPCLRILALITGSLVIAAGLSAQSQPVKIFVAVRDQAGQPVLDLDPRAFEVTVGDTKGRIVRVSLATEPMRIALLVDTSEEAKRSLNHIRNGLQAFLDAVPPENEILLMTTGGQGRVRVSTTLDRTKLKSTVDGLFADGGAVVLLDALVESWTRYLRGAENRWPVFVTLSTDGPDNSSVRENQFETFIREIQRAAATAHAFTLSSSTQTSRNSRAFLASEAVTRSTGGQYEVLAASSALPGRMKALGEQLADHQRRMSTQYEVDFVSASKDPEARIIVNVAREGASIALSAGRRLH